jgi:hypothetical protein
LVSIFQLVGGALTLVYSKTMTETIKEDMLYHLQLKYAAGG